MEKLTQEIIKKYPLGNEGIKMMTSENQGSIITPIAQMDFTEKDSICGNGYMDIDYGYYPYSINSIKLILRDLDLTKEIEHNGEKFVPRTIINILSKSKIGASMYFIEKCLESNKLEGLPFWVIQKLFEWHFDVEGLIEKGLAISYNEIK